MPVFSYVLISLNSLWYAWLRSGVDRLSSAEKQRGDYTGVAWPIVGQSRLKMECWTTTSYPLPAPRSPACSSSSGPKDLLVD